MPISVRARVQNTIPAQFVNCGLAPRIGENRNNRKNLIGTSRSWARWGTRPRDRSANGPHESWCESPYCRVELVWYLVLKTMGADELLTNCVRHHSRPSGFRSQVPGTQKLLPRDRYVEINLHRTTQTELSRPLRQIGRTQAIPPQVIKVSVAGVLDRLGQIESPIRNAMGYRRCAMIAMRHTFVEDTTTGILFPRTERMVTHVTRSRRGGVFHVLDTVLESRNSHDQLENRPGVQERLIGSLESRFRLGQIGVGLEESRVGSLAHTIGIKAGIGAKRENRTGNILA